MAKTKSKLKSIQKKNWEICREIVLKRDGNVCMVQYHYPKIYIAHSQIMQADHCFSCQIKALYFDLANLTTICSTCNQAKGSGKISSSKRDAITVAVHEIVKKREGEDTYKRLFEVGGNLCSFPEWRSILWQEDQNKILTEMLEGIND